MFPRQAEKNAWHPPGQVEPAEGANSALLLSGFYARRLQKKSIKNKIRRACDFAPVQWLCWAFALTFVSFLADGTEQGCVEGVSPNPARKRLDMRTRVRTPSISGGMAGCAAPRIRKMTSAASPGESALEPMPKPCTPGFCIHSSVCTLCTVFARASSLSVME